MTEDLTQGDVAAVVGGVAFGPAGLVPAIVQDAASRDVLMLGYTNAEAMRRTLTSGRTWFFSRSRQRLWAKGETSGSFQRVRRVSIDCDGDAIIVEVDQQGSGACHTGAWSCFEERFVADR